MFDGGMFLSKSFMAENDTSKKYQFAICWGKLIRDTEVAIYNKKKTSFTIKWHNNSFQNVTAWGDSDVASSMEQLQKGDMVFVAGTMIVGKYTVRKGEHAGEERESRDINPNIVIPLGLIMYLMQSLNANMALTGNAQKILDSIGVEFDKTDEMESAADDFEGGDDDFMSVPDDEVEGLFM